MTRFQTRYSGFGIDILKVGFRASLSGFRIWDLALARCFAD